MVYFISIPHNTCQSTNVSVYYPFVQRSGLLIHRYQRASRSDGHSGKCPFKYLLGSCIDHVIQHFFDVSQRESKVKSNQTIYKINNCGNC